MLSLRPSPPLWLGHSLREDIIRKMEEGGGVTLKPYPKLVTPTRKLLFFGAVAGVALILRNRVHTYRLLMFGPHLYVLICYLLP